MAEKATKPIRKPAPQKKSTQVKRAPVKKAAPKAPIVALADTKKSDPGPDWGRIEMDYRAGVKSNREIGAEHGVTEGAIRKKAKQQDWQKDLNAKIQAKADELVRREAVRSEVRANQAASERLVVDSNAQAIANVRLEHRKDIARARTLTNTLLAELEQMSDAETRKLLEGLPRLVLTDEDATSAAKLAAIFQAIMSLPERAKTMKTLAESMQKLVEMERTAFAMDKEQTKEVDALSGLLSRIATGNNSAFQPVADDPELQHPAGKRPLGQPQADDDGDEG